MEAAASDRAVVDAGASPAPDATIELEQRLEAWALAPERETTPPAELATIQSRDALYLRTLAISDIVAYAAAIFPAAAIAGVSVNLVAFAAAPALVVLAKVLGLYDRDQYRLHRETLEEVPQLFNFATLTALLTFFAGGFLFEGTLGEASTAVLWGVFFLALIVGRAASRLALTGIATTERCLVIGDVQVASMLSKKLAVQGLNARIVGALRDEEDGWTPQLIERTLKTIERYAVHRVILTSECWRADETIHAVGDLKASGVKVSILPPISRLATLSFELDRLPGIALMGMRGFGLSRSSRMIKRAFDFACAGFVIAILSPLLAAIAIAIKLNTPGPVFFRQIRIGRNGKPFHLFKFRSMVTDAEERKHELAHLNEADGFFKITDDPRITRVGRFIRRTSLDELPQLFNVLRGEMSLVGPRPLIVEEDSQIEGAYRRRLDITPGMTGPWQVLGSWRVPFEEMVTLDYLYVTTWSLWRDVKLLAQTVPHVVGRNGA